MRAAKAPMRGTAEVRTLLQMMINDADQSLYVFKFLTLNVNAFILNWSLMEFLLSFYIIIYAICDNLGLFCPVGCFYCALKSCDCVPSCEKPPKPELLDFWLRKDLQLFKNKDLFFPPKVSRVSPA